MKLRGYFIEEYWRRKRIQEEGSTSPIRFEERTEMYITRRMYMLSYGDPSLISRLYNEWLEVKVAVVFAKAKEKKLKEEAKSQKDDDQ